MKPESINQQAFYMFALCFAAMILGMDKAPLFLEEPRRGLVAMEMLYSGDFIHTTIHGAAYYNKPPLFNWLIAGGFKLFGFQNWIPRIITMISHLLVGWMVFQIGKRYFSPKAGLIAGALYLAGADILFYFSFLGEIDVFFSMLVVAAWFTFFHYMQTNRRLAAYGLFYFFLLLAFLTKGLPAILFAGFTLVGWAFWNRSWKILFCWQQFAGLALFLLLAGLYLLPFLTQGDMDILLSTFWNQSVERTAGGQSVWERVQAFLLFPVGLLKDIFPASLLLLTFTVSGFRNYMKQNQLFVFCVIVFVANIWVYLVSPDSRSRYLYMFHPLLILPIVQVFLQSSPLSKMTVWVNRIFSFLPYLIAGILGLALFLVPIFLKVNGAILVLSICFAGALFFLWIAKKEKYNPIYLTVLMLFLVRMAGGWITNSERGQNSQAAKDRVAGVEMARIIGNSPIYLPDSTRISTTISFYLQKELGRMVPFSADPKSGDFLILSKNISPDAQPFLYKFDYQGNTFVLIRK